MPIFLKLRCKEGHDIWINFDKVVTMDALPKGVTQIALAHEEAYYMVTETPEDILMKLRAEIMRMQSR